MDGDNIARLIYLVVLGLAVDSGTPAQLKVAAAELAGIGDVLSRDTAAS